MRISETVLEMHYHTKVISLIKKKLGLGANASFNFYKYSPQREKFVGFDQAFVMTQAADDALFNALKISAMGNSYNMGPTFVGLFLQYKVVQQLHKRSRKNPPPVTSTPYYRVGLYTARTTANDKSQHELLYDLEKSNPGAFVYYACPMLFDKERLYQKANLNDLRLATLSSCPSPYKDNDKHFIFYDTPTAKPIWKSDPVIGDAITAEQMAGAVVNYLRETSPSDSAAHVLSLLSNLSITPDSNEEPTETKSDLLADALTVISFERSSTSRA